MESALQTAKQRFMTTTMWLPPPGTDDVAGGAKSLSQEAGREIVAEPTRPLRDRKSQRSAVRS